MLPYPKISFGIIVLNGEPFVRYCLRSIYAFAHEIIVVEGGHEDARSVCTPDGHSIDTTLNTLYNFKKEEDVENKLIIITRNGFWPKKDELGRDRTPQSRAYADKATGDYLWQIDIDEFYKEEDIVEILKMLNDDNSITAISFKQKSFWGSIDYISDSIYLRKNKGGWHRIFKWGKGYKYLTHEPPTVIDENGVDLRNKKWIQGEIMEKKGIFMYHYCLLFPSQVEQKVRIYKDEKPEEFSEMVTWANQNFFKINNPFRVHNVYTYPSWLYKFNNDHPKQINLMMNDINSKIIITKIRQTEDIENLLNKWWYPLGILKHRIYYYWSDKIIKIRKLLQNIKNSILNRKIKYLLLVIIISGLL